MSPEGVFDHGQVRILEFEAPRMVGNNQFENRSKKKIGFLGGRLVFRDADQGAYVPHPPL